jgi:hypothetical protein
MGQSRTGPVVRYQFEDFVRQPKKEIKSRTHSPPTIIVFIEKFHQRTPCSRGTRLSKGWSYFMFSDAVFVMSPIRIESIEDSVGYLSFDVILVRAQAV